MLLLSPTGYLSKNFINVFTSWQTKSAILLKILPAQIGVLILYNPYWGGTLKGQ